MKKSGLVAVGELGKPHGLRGEVCVVNHADSPTLYSQVDKIYLASGNARPRAVTVEGQRPHKGRVLLKLKGIDGRDQAEAWRGATLMVRRKDLPETDPDEIYWHDLFGMDVYLPDGEHLGELSRIEAMPHEVWIITTPKGEEILFAAHPDNVEDIDLEANRAVIDPPPGLLELYLDGEGDDAFPDENVAGEGTADVDSIDTDAADETASKKNAANN